MIIQYDDIIYQVIDRLKIVFPQTPAKVAEIKPMANYQSDIDDFIRSSEIPKILVTYSGNTSEGGREVSDYVVTNNDNVQKMGHTIEVHICTKGFMAPDYVASKTMNGMMLKMMHVARAGLVGLKFYGREADVVVKKNEYELTEGTFHLESYIDRSHQGAWIAVCRFQVMEIIPEAEDLNAEEIWFQYKEITLEEYSQADGQTPNISGSPNEEAVETGVESE